MARCQSCDCLLTDLEATRKDIHGDYVELCNSCLHTIREDVILSNNYDLNIINKLTDD